jgi:hypothetical protein
MSVLSGHSFAAAHFCIRAIPIPQQKGLSNDWQADSCCGSNGAWNERGHRRSTDEHARRRNSGNAGNAGDTRNAGRSVDRHFCHSRNTGDSSRPCDARYAGSADADRHD